MSVMIGMRPLRKACRQSTVGAVRPLERAVVMYSALMTSSIEARV